ncbi:MAG: ABC transporter permease [Dehalococcoidia bacterium]
MTTGSTNSSHVAVPHGHPPHPRGRRHRIARFARQNPTAVVGGTILIVIGVVAVFAPLLAPYPPSAIDPVERLQAPSARHWFGTDAVGQDVLSRVIFGARVSLAVGLAVTALSSLLGLAIGLITGMSRRADLVIMRVIDGLMAFPGLLLALAMIAVVGPAASVVVIVLTIVQVPSTARLIRSTVLKLREEPFIESARAVGANDCRLVIRHILPNTVPPLLVFASFHFTTAVLSEASLSFLGAGVPPSTPSWGNIIGTGKVLFQQAPWLTIVPGLAIIITVLSMSMVGDSLRDELDPTLSHRA